MVSALYGKIIGPIRPFVEKTDGKLVLYLHYFLNSTPNDTNLEFDSTRNLLVGQDPYTGMSGPKFH